MALAVYNLLDETNVEESRFAVKYRIVDQSTPIFENELVPREINPRVSSICPIVSVVDSREEEHKRRFWLLFSFFFLLYVSVFISSCLCFVDFFLLPSHWKLAIYMYSLVSFIFIIDDSVNRNLSVQIVRIRVRLSLSCCDGALELHLTI